MVGEAAGGDSAPAGESVVRTGGHSDGAGGLPRLPAQVPQKGVTQSSPSAGGVPGDVGAAVERTSGGTGETVDEAAPPAEEPVAGAGETTGGTVGETPPAIDETVSGGTGTVEDVTEGVTGATGQLPETPPP
jgi:hypothetical protein